jgi:hypothetical protein
VKWLPVFGSFHSTITTFRRDDDNKNECGHADSSDSPQLLHYNEIPVIIQGATTMHSNLVIVGQTRCTDAPQRLPNSSSLHRHNDDRFVEISDSSVHGVDALLQSYRLPSRGLHGNCDDDDIGQNLSAGWQSDYRVPAAL